jgi:two-component system NtrC family sensor kinase
MPWPTPIHSRTWSSLFALRRAEILIITLGFLAIAGTTIFTTRLAIDRLKRTDQEMVELNAQLVQSDKLAALGKMAAGVAHEINNPLVVILQKTGWIEDVLEDVAFREGEEIDEIRKSIAKIEEHVERARKVVHNMLVYARRMEPRLEDVDLNETISQTVAFLDNHARTNTIDIHLDLDESIPIIASDQAQLQQIFLNLLTNAIDAIGSGGTIEATSRCSKRQDRGDHQGRRPRTQRWYASQCFRSIFHNKGTRQGYRSRAVGKPQHHCQNGRQHSR